MGDVVDITKGKSKPPRAARPAHGACGAKTRNGGACKKQKGWGTEHLGSGRCKLHGGNTESGTKAAANEAAAIMGAELDIDPHDALLQCIRITAGEISYCSTLIGDLDEPMVMTPFGEMLSIWITTRQKAIERLAKFSKMALDAGVAERQVQVAERYGEMLATLVSGILGDLKLSKAQQKEAPAVVRKHFQLIEGGAQAA
jgi:hypothetical protein